MSRFGHSSALSTFSHRLGWPVLGLWVLLGYLGFEANHHWHRHVLDGIVHAHDHLSAGPHSHKRKESGGDPADPKAPDPQGQDGYLGHASVHLSLDSSQGPLLASPLAYHADECPAAPRSPLEREYSPRSPRGPPPVLAVLV